MATETGDFRAEVTGAVPWGRWGAFLLAGLVVYLALFAWSEYLVRQHGQSNRFFMVHQAPPTSYDIVILGASHAMPLGYGDMNVRLEAATGARTINLSMEGAGILPNRLILDYFLTRHSTDRVVYVVDAFAFFDRQWNEDRLTASMLNRAPLDIGLARVLWKYDWARTLLLPYLSGFGKINNSDRFAADEPEGAAKFESTYRPIAQIDRRRVRFLFPEDGMEEHFDGYLADFRALADFIERRGMEMVVIRPPTPPRYRDNLPDISLFTDAMADLAATGEITYHDLSETVTEDPYFYDTDHLNREGVMRLIDLHLGPLLGAGPAE